MTETDQSPQEPATPDGDAEQRPEPAAPRDRDGDDGGRDHEPVVVGLGASAGGLEACQALLEAMPRSSSVCLVLIQHLDPDRQSLIVELLARHTEMPVTEAEDGIELEPGHLYINPPGSLLSMDGDTLRVVQPDDPRRFRTPIDRFLISLAASMGPRAVGVVLSGTGQDGSLGLRAIKEGGGMTIAQDEATAKYPGMPRSAAATGYVDHVLAVQEIPDRLVDYSRHRERLLDRDEAKTVEADTVDHLDQIVALLETRVGHSFRNYKRNTVLRRILRRMAALQTDSAADYLELLRTDRDEPNRLFQDLLIGVTQFFRDPDAFEVLDRSVLQPLVRSKGLERTIRVWVPGCPTGEEAYSIAILLMEAFDAAGQRPKIQIFASDIDQRALEVARTGTYSDSVTAELDRRLVDRYFERTGHGLRVAKKIRELVIFSRHDLISDPPFSRLDLISCRNLLIYLDKQLQRRVLPVFHYALRPDGFLFLGPSEAVTLHRDLFSEVDKSYRLFQARDITPNRMGFPMQIESARRLKEETFAVLPEPENLGQRVERLLLEAYCPACVVVDERGEVLHFHGHTGRYLEPPAGAPTNNVVQLARQGLRMELRNALHKAVRDDTLVHKSELRLQRDDTVEWVHLTVHPLPTNGQEARLLAVLFDRRRIDEVSELEEEIPVGEGSEDPVVQELERELHNTREHLQTTIEELETSNEELRSSNEELMSMNEELQSSNEELETSKEELQSVNEELETVNAELGVKIDELARLNSDLENLFESTRIATVFLDPDLRIKSFTPAARRVFRLRDSDLSRPITDLTHRLEDPPDLVDEVRGVLDDLVPRERQLRLQPANGQNAEWHMLRILPYRTIDNVIDGVVLTFVDISAVKRAEAEIARLNGQLERSLAELEAVVDLVPVGLAIAEDASCERIRVNQHGAELLGIESGSNASLGVGHGPQAGSNYRALVDDQEIPPERLPLQRACIANREVADERITIVRDDGEKVEILMSASPLRAPDGEVVGGVGAYVDITREIGARREIERRERQQAAVARLGMTAVSATDPDQLFGEACDTVMTTLGADFAKVLELDEEREELLVRAGCGWRDGIVGAARVPSSHHSQAGYTLAVSEPVIVEDLAEETRFQGPDLLTDHGVRSGISVTIQTTEGPWGVLGIHNREPRQFTKHDVHFVQAVASLLTAILERGRIQAELTTSQEELAYRLAQERLMRSERLASLGTLAAGIAHEVNNPINSISMTAETAQIALARGDQARLPDDLDVIVHEAERCRQIIGNVLDFVRDRRAEKQPTRLNVVILRALELGRKYAAQAGAEIDTDLGEDLPPVEVNQTEIEQVVINLVQNAVEAGDGQVTVRLRTRRSRLGVRLDIEDDGPGIEPEYLERIFDPFFTTRRDRGGTGLGLSLAYDIVVEGHGGRIDVFSEPGHGTRFEIELPAARTGETDPPEEAT